jgi:pyridoxal 5'-phosphate synthase pdxS subunit
MEKGTLKLKNNLAETLRGGVIMDVTTLDQAKIAEEAGAVSVMALEKIPADIRSTGGVARMTDPEIIIDIMNAVSIPVMAKCRIGHFAEAQILESIGIDFIDESEVLTPADEKYHINKSDFKTPFVCGATNLGEALRRIGEGAAMIRTKGEAGTGNVVEAVRHMRAIKDGINKVTVTPKEELMTLSKELGAPYDLILYIKENGKLPVLNFSAGGIAIPADAAMILQLGADGVFVGSGIFKSENPLKMAKAIVDAAANFSNPELLAKVSKGLGSAMSGMEISKIPQEELLAKRGW